MGHRIFIAINLPEEIKKKLLVYQSKWPELPIRWIKKDNIHITLFFLGYISNEDVLEACKTTKEVALRHKPFSINLTRICYGPPKKMPPRMIWAEGEKSEEFGALRDDLAKYFPSEDRAFTPHITLGRIRAWEWRTIEPEERPEVETELDLSFEVNSIEVMESVLKRGGAEYAVLESCQLQS